jgi:alanine racemase
MARPTHASIDLNAIIHNHQIAATHCPGSKIMAAIKANAYGHGAVEVASALENQAHAFGVASIDEALELRTAGITKRIVLLGGYYHRDELDLVLEHDLDLVVHQISDIETLLKIHSQHELKLWFKLETGMHRLGMLPSEVLQAHKLLSQRGNAQMIVMTHFAQADNLDSEQNQHQWQTFSQVAAQLQIATSAANSAIILKWPQFTSDWIRPGIMLYGASPFAANEQYFNLQPVMTLSSQVVAIRQVTAQDFVGYAGIYQAQQTQRIATIAVGYADGYPPTAKVGTPVLIGKEYAKLVGRPCMDMLMVDISHMPQVKLGDRAILWGKGLRLETIASWADTIPHTLVTAVKRNRVKLVYI